MMFLGAGRVERSLSWRKSWHITVLQGATGFGVGVEVGSGGLGAEGVFVGMGEGGGCVAPGGGFSVAVADGSIDVRLGAGVGGSGEGTKVEAATLRVAPPRVGVGGEERWAALGCKGSRGKRSQAAREPNRRAVKIISTPTPLLNQPLFDPIRSLSKKRCGAALLPHTYRPLSFNLSLGHACQTVVGRSMGPIRPHDAEVALFTCSADGAEVQVPEEHDPHVATILRNLESAHNVIGLFLFAVVTEICIIGRW